MDASPAPPHHRLTLREWLRLTRLFSLTAAAVPVLLGTALAAGRFRFLPLPFLAMLLASLLIQAATNMFNEYYDAVRGLDASDSVGISGSIVSGRLEARAVLRSALWTYAAAALLSLYLVFEGGALVLGLGLLAALAGYLYSGGPRPIAYTPFGELTVFLSMGPLIVTLSYAVQTHQLSALPLLASLPIGFLVAAILLANSIRDLEGDALGGRRTLAILVGRRRAIRLYRSLLWASYAVVAALVLARQISPWALLSLASAALALRLYREVAGSSGRIALNRVVRGTSGLHLALGLLLTLGVLLGQLRL
jgi:1,4-dihydroxy-2-naphthoate octaprenyltransferase